MFNLRRPSGQAVITGVAASLPRYMPCFFRAEGSAFPLLVDWHRSFPTRALAFSASELGNTQRKDLCISTPAGPQTQHNRQEG